MESRKEWSRPIITLHGNVEDLTLVRFPCHTKQIGSSDGFTFQGIPIKCFAS